MKGQRSTQKRGVGIFPHGHKAINVIRHPPRTPTDHKHRTHPLATLSTLLFLHVHTTKKKSRDDNMASGINIG